MSTDKACILTINGGSSSIKFALYRVEKLSIRSLYEKIDKLFCYTMHKWIGAFAAVLGGLDTLVFAGGIGENSLEVRSRICNGLGFLGIEIEEKRNKANSTVISTNNGQATVRVIHTDEEWMIAKSVCRILNLTINKEG